MSLPFSAAAGPQALGYLYQAQYALYALLTADGEESALILEGLDDVELQSATATELQQLKHHLSTKRQAVLSNRSTDWWKTLRVWGDLLQKQQWDPLRTRLALITTATAAPGSIPSLLRDDAARDPAEALKQLVTLAATAPSQALAAPVQVFNSLTALQQKQLVQAIVVLDQSPTMPDLEGAIKKALGYIASADKKHQVYLHLLGWWYRRVADQLVQPQHVPITKIDLEILLDELRSQFHQHSLPVEFARAESDEAYYRSQEGRPFVRQLDFLNLRIQRIRYAVKDYYQAFSQRTKWGVDGLLFVGELSAYEADLKEQWAHYVDRLTYTAEFSGNLEENVACVQFGQRVLEWVEIASFPIRAAMPPKDEYITRGTFHILANEDLPAVYWHPKLLDKLAEIAALATA